MSADPDVFVHLPVYRGADVLPETIRSIREQTHEGFRVLVSVDGGDRESLAVCERLVAGDARFDVVLQAESLGWPGNFNWLVERCDLPFLIYWQQDDLASTGYLAALRAALLADSRAAVAFTDVQWFGAKFGRDVEVGFDGPPLARVFSQFEGISYVPLRGLMRASMLPPGPAIPPSRDRGAQGEFIFLAGLAARGAFVRVQDAMYFKRAHDAAETLRLHAMSAYRRRREAARLGAGVLRHALDVAPPGTEGEVLALVVDRLAVHRPGRSFYFEPEPSIAGVRDIALLLADEADLDLTDERWAPGLLTGLERPVHPRVWSVLTGERERGAQLRSAAPPLPARLGWGWHDPEAWGAWSRGEHASVELGSWPGGALRLEGRVYAPRDAVRIGWSTDGNAPVFATFSDGDRVRLGVTPPAGAARIQLHLPDAVSPVQAHESGDPRVLSFGLERCTAV